MFLHETAFLLIAMCMVMAFVALGPTQPNTTARHTRSPGNQMNAEEVSRGDSEM